MDEHVGLESRLKSAALEEIADGADAIGVSAALRQAADEIEIDHQATPDDIEFLTGELADADRATGGGVR